MEESTIKLNTHNSKCVPQTTRFFFLFRQISLTVTDNDVTDVNDVTNFDLFVLKLLVYTIYLFLFYF